MRISRFIYHIRHEKHLPKAVKFSITFAFVFVLLLSQNLVMVSAITQEQRNSIGSGARYFNTEEDGSNICAPTTPTDGQQGGSVYFVGDSLTAGMKSQGQLQKKLSDAGYDRSTIQATVGDSVTDALAKVSNDKADIAKASTVVVALGTNDGAGTSESAFTPRLKQMISAIRSANNSAIIYWMNAYKDGDTAAYKGINSALSNQSESQSYKVIDWNSEAKNNNSKYAPFDKDLMVHPKDYSALAAFVAGSLSGSSGSTNQAGCCTTNLSGDGEKAQVINFLLSQTSPKLNPIAVAALGGNIEDESGFSPTAENPDSGAYGIVQWLGGRLTALNKMSSDTGRPISDMGLQLDYMWDELTDGPYTTNIAKRSFKSLVTDVINSPSANIESATQRVYDYYEGLLDSGQGSIAGRTKNAREILELISNGSLSGSGGSVANCSNGGGETIPPGTPVGDSSTPCDPRTEDIGVYIGYRNEEAVQIRLCALSKLNQPQLPCNNTECNDGYGVSGAKGRGLVNSTVSKKWFELIAAAKRDGIQLYGNSTYRTMENQEKLCADNAGCSGNPPDYTWVAKPGTSNHQMGYAIDIGDSGYNAITSGSTQFNWLKANAAKYGIYNYPKEPWHWSPTGS